MKILMEGVAMKILMYQWDAMMEQKSVSTPVYINKKSNHPPVVLKQLPKSIAKRISHISSDENIFCYSIPIYSEALKKVVLMTN